MTRSNDRPVPVISDELRRRSSEVKLVAFDVDGTLLDHPEGKTIWQVFNLEFLDSARTNRSRFEAFFDGVISYPEWVALDILDWKAHGARRERLLQLIDEQLHPIDGARDVVAEIKGRGYIVAIVSGTLNLTLERILPELPVDRVYCNVIAFDEEGGILAWEATPFDHQGKAEALKLLASDYGVPMSQVAFIGDSWNDVYAFDEAGVSIAYNPKVEGIAARTDLVIDDLRVLLDMFPGSAAR